jgi:site-specific recombinase XerD
MHAKPCYCKNAKWNSTCRQFIASLSSEITRNTYSQTLKRLIEFSSAKHGTSISPDKISSEDIKDFLKQPSKMGRNKGQSTSAYTHNSYLAAIKSFYRYCATNTAEFRGKQKPLISPDRLPTNGIAGQKVGNVDRDMTEGEVRSFFAAINRGTTKGKRNYALFKTLLITGRRRFEITLLRRGDLEQCEFDGGKKGWRFWFRGKKRQTRECTEMPAACMSAIMDYHQAAGRDFDTMDADQALFPGTETRKRPLTLSSVDVIFRQCARAAGISEQVVIHSLRWENAYQRYLANDHDLLKTQEQMGWATIEQAAHYIRRKKRKNAGDVTANSIAEKFAF